MFLGRRTAARGLADLDPGQAAAKVKVGIETDRGPWVGALVAAGCKVFPIALAVLPKQAWKEALAVMGDYVRAPRSPS